MDTDSTLLAAYARDRSEAAFGELVRRHLPLVYSAALRRTEGDAHHAQDVAQIVFTALAREAAALSRHPTLAGWLYTATRNAATGLMRAERRRQQREEKAHAMEEISSAPATPSADWQQLRPVLDEAMDELDRRDREAVLLRFFEGQPFAAVAAGLRVSEDAARKRVDRALDKLGALLARRGITSTSGALAVLLASQAGVAAPAGVAASVTTLALAGAATGTASAGAVGLFIMSTSKAVTSISAALALVAVGTAVYQADAARASEATAAALRTERDGLHARVAAAEKLAQDSAAKLAAAERTLDVLRQRATATALPPAPPALRPAASALPSESAAARTPDQERMAQLKPRLAAGLPIKGAIVIVRDGQPQQVPVEFVVGKETTFPAGDLGTYLVTPALQEDGAVLYTLRLKTNAPDGKEEIKTPARILTKPWSGFTISGNGGYTMAWDPDNIE